jgi:hypothetical protein
MMMMMMMMMMMIRNVEVVVDEVRSAKSRAVGSSTRLGSKQPSCS